MKTNVKEVKPKKLTHGGAVAYQHNKPFDDLHRSVMSCFLWENEFYEDGVQIADRIQSLADKCTPEEVAAIAVEARTVHHLRHVSLLLLVCLLKKGKPMVDERGALAVDRAGGSIIRHTIAKVVKRADELAELLALYWKINGNDKPLSNQLKKGLALAFPKFNAYSLGKYNRDGAVKLRDSMFLAHPKPKDSDQAEVWQKLAGNTLESPDTWEVNLSSGKNKKETFERLLKEDKLGYFALVRNLRNMVESDCDRTLVRNAILARKNGAEMLLPFRFIAAAKAAPKFESELDTAMLANLSQLPKLSGKTVAIIDVSGSMYHAQVSAKSDMTRAHAACGLAAILREVCEEPVIYATAGNDITRVHQTQLVPSRRGMSLVDSIYNMCGPLGGGGIFLTQVIDFVRQKEKTADRIIVITDEQDCDHENAPSKANPFGATNYLLNVASGQNGIGYKPDWVHINGFSENVVRYIYAAEGQAVSQSQTEEN